MAIHYTNKHNISLALATFLMFDSYDYDPRPNAISATSLIRPLRQIVLTRQNRELLKTVDISDLVSSRMGNAIHDGCERAWKDKDNIAAALKALGASDTAINTVKINPVVLEEGDVPVYVEQRTERKILDFIVSGKFDLVLDGTANDYKSCSVWAYIFDSNRENYIKQGSIYKWLNPDKITSDYINIHFIFTDWSKMKAKQDPKRYPQLRTLTKKYPLWSTEETENWIMNRLEAIAAIADSPQDQLPLCSNKELWATDTKYKYYKNPDKMTKSTKNFDTMDEAIARKANDGDAGTIVKVPGEVKACLYCPVLNICTQAKTLIAEGRLVL